MRGLKDILHGIPVRQVIGNLNVAVDSLTFDSRKVGVNCLFVAVKGTQVDGHRFIGAAVSSGASAILCEQLPETTHDDVTYVQVDDTAFALGVSAANYFENPSKKLRLVGITGTNGKTTIATLLYKLFREMGYEAGLISTVKNQVGDRTVAATHTTPDPVALNGLLQEMVQTGCDYCFMEVSSHAIAQQRIAGLNFAGGIFSNITHDHLDFHKTFDAYIKAKKTFFDGLDRFAFALSNADDKNGLIMLQNTFAHRKTYGIKSMADFKAKVIESHFDGMLLHLDGHEVWVKLVGGFNAYNILAVYGAAILLEQETMKVLTALSSITGAEGRFDATISKHGVVGVVDYAHTPDAVQNVLQTIQSLRKNNETIITVLGCGGDRDKAKRPKMAAVAAKYSDKVIITSDNPRTEDPLQIIHDMEAGIPADRKRDVFSIADRREAIRAACHLAKPGDILLIAGKGHEKYQEINGKRYDFDDKQVLINAFNEQ
ncbi:UDP-N-acetylmuramoyl-L-alanyl-D-glutamate--2,6-diaminopimelate ligase [Parapedobacter composti]|uniref:UDP-N-acetylmuramoyl-L-alanyl-D-glutamate--2,6-diaminopimelate ligase n=1 Tax=Parapedobacter composti TaxID=623281 RepID=A0A1I1GX62_9SPHI|nr:UDP-N-acetylmuramoyl-L-alanyl-D-glutamate--2,6-diaminopimelate ligase [Parapedobacter composti]SFC16264.1 UDP-N-acetylmuramoyl-L-alanyl-D-glutamate--2,6-diaminopimelate ligase [Parapedobacter composti]